MYVSDSRLRILKDHIEDIINNRSIRKITESSPSKALSYTIAPYISLLLVGFLTKAFIPAFVSAGIISYITGIDSKAILKIKIMEYLPDTLKKKMNNKIEDIINPIIEEWGTDEKIKKFFGFNKDKGIVYAIQRFPLFVKIIHKQVIKLLSGFVDVDDIRLGIINEYLVNIEDSEIRSQLANLFGVPSPNFIGTSSETLTMEHTFLREIKNCEWFKGRSFYDAIFENEMLVKLHLLIWVKSLPNHLKLKLYLEYNPNLDIPKKYITRYRTEIIHFFLDSQLVQLMNMNDPLGPYPKGVC